MEEKDKEKTYDVFISYAWANNDIVTEIRNYIENYIPNVKIWQDKTSTEISDKLWQEILQAIPNSKCMLVMHSNAYLLSASCYKEWQHAGTENIPRIPIVLKEEGEPEITKSFVAIEYGSDTKYCVYSVDSSKRDLLEKISQICNKPINRKSYEVKGNGLAVKFDMIRIAANNEDKIQFNMGSDRGYANEKPVHSQEFHEYYIGETTVTQALWYAVMGGVRPQDEDMDKPKVNITYKDCKKFIIELNQLTEATFRVPYENEWEYAARGGKDDSHLEDSDINASVWYEQNSNNTLQHVMQKKPNAFGLYDMLGNVWEWCKNEYYDYSAADAHYKKSADTKSNKERIIRGGSYMTEKADCTVSCRRKLQQTKNNNYTGLRLAMTFAQKQ